MLRAVNPRHGKIVIQVWAIEQERPGTHAEARPQAMLRKARQMDKLETARMPSSADAHKQADADSPPGAAVAALEHEEGEAEPQQGRDVFVPWRLQQQQQQKQKRKPQGNAKVSKATNTTSESDSAQVSGQGENPSGKEREEEKEKEKTYQRYYHLFQSGELKSLVLEARDDLGLQDSLEVDDDEEWEQGNWCIQARFRSV